MDPLASKFAERTHARDAHAKPLRLLVVDDDPAIVQYLERALATAGHEVLTASNGREALALALDKLPHIVITDWIMPEMDGVSFCRALRATAHGRATYVLVMTDAKDTKRAVEAFAAGADDYVWKPITPSVLDVRLLAARRALHRQAG